MLKNSEVHIMISTQMYSPWLCYVLSFFILLCNIPLIFLTVAAH